MSEHTEGRQSPCPHLTAMDQSQHWHLGWVMWSYILEGNRHSHCSWLWSKRKGEHVLLGNRALRLGSHLSWLRVAQQRSPFLFPISGTNQGKIFAWIWPWNWGKDAQCFCAVRSAAALEICEQASIESWSYSPAMRIGCWETCIQFA